MTNLLKVFSGPPSAEQATRAGLRATIEKYRAAELALESKSAAVRRLHQLIEEAFAAKALAAQTQAAVTQAAAEWAAAGANDGEALADKSLIDLASKHERQASDAHIRAAGAQLALPGAQNDVEDSKRACKEAGGRIYNAIGSVLAAMVEPQVAKLAQGRRVYLEAFATLRALERVINMHWGVAHPWHNLGPHDAALSNTLDDLAMPHETIRHGRGTQPASPKDSPERWAQLAKRLATDAVADFKNGSDQ